MAATHPGPASPTAPSVVLGVTEVNGVVAPVIAMDLGSSEAHQRAEYLVRQTPVIYRRAQAVRHGDTTWLEVRYAVEMDSMLGHGTEVAIALTQDIWQAIRDAQHNVGFGFLLFHQTPARNGRQIIQTDAVDLHYIPFFAVDIAEALARTPTWGR